MQTTNSKPSVAYVWSHFAFSPIFKGVQNGHCLTKIGRHYKDNEIYIKWAQTDQTLKYMCGGNSKKLSNIWGTLFEMFVGTDIPFAFYKEDSETLEGIMTSVSLVLPGDVLTALGSTEDPVKEVAHLLVKKYKINKVKASVISKFVEIVTSSRWAI